MLALAAGLRGRYDAEVVCPDSAGGRRLLARAQRDGIPARALQPPPSPAKERQTWATEVRFGGYDLVHVHAGVAFEGCELVLAARRADTRMVLRTEHLPYEVQTPEQAERYRRAAEAVDRLICVSQGVADSFRRAGVPPARLAVVHNGVPAIQPAHPSPVRRRMGLADDVLVVLTPARFSEQKGHRYLLPAVQSVVRSRADVLFVWSRCRSDLQRHAGGGDRGRSQRLRAVPAAQR